MTGSAKGASTCRAGATPAAIASADATRAVAGSGIASVIHHAIARARIARSRRASGGWPPGFHRKTTNGERGAGEEPGRLQAALEARLEVRGGHGARL